MGRGEGMTGFVRGHDVMFALTGWWWGSNINVVSTH